MRKELKLRFVICFFLNIIRKWPHLVRLLLGSHTIDEQRLLL